jgi:excisionase family DNA binding protein
MDNLITKEDERVASFLDNIDRINRSLDGLVSDCHPRFNGEAYLTDKEASLVLHISRRTLQEYRTQGILPYHKMGGKVLYRESDIEKVLQDNYQKALRIDKRWY